MGMHIQSIDGQIVRRQVETLEYFFKRQVSKARVVRGGTETCTVEINQLTCRLGR
jgi:hypothetical protein